MRTFTAKLLKDLTYIENCVLRVGQKISVTQMDNKTNWILDEKSNQLIKLFSHEFQVQ